MFCYAAVIWWSRTTYKTVGRQLEHLQRLACLYISGAVRTTPTAALEIIVGITPLPVYVKQEAMASCNRLKSGAQWVSTNCGHTLIYYHLSQLIPVSRMRCDKIPTKFIFSSNYTVETPSREEWKNNKVKLVDNVICFTDGSWNHSHTRASFYNQSIGEIFPYLSVHYAQSSRLKFTPFYNVRIQMTCLIGTMTQSSSVLTVRLL